MASDFTGTNTEKIDKLVATVIELRITLRICLGFILGLTGVGLPLMVGLLTFLVVQSFSTAAKVEKLNDPISIIKSDLGKVTERLDKLDRPR